MRRLPALVPWSATSRSRAAPCCFGSSSQSSSLWPSWRAAEGDVAGASGGWVRSEEHRSELQSRLHLVCRLLLEKKKRTRARAGNGTDPRCLAALGVSLDPGRAV